MLFVAGAHRLLPMCVSSISRSRVNPRSDWRAINRAPIALDQLPPPARLHPSDQGPRQGRAPLRLLHPLKIQKRQKLRLHIVSNVIPVSEFKRVFHRAWPDLQRMKLLLPRCPSTLAMPRPASSPGKRYVGAQHSIPALSRSHQSRSSGFFASAMRLHQFTRPRRRGGAPKARLDAQPAHHGRPRVRAVSAHRAAHSVSPATTITGASSTR